MIQYALTIFVSAFLLFQVQPLIGKYILPWFGGTPNVWSTCVLFFQVVLLCGYAYAHFLASWLPLAVQRWAHAALLAGSAVFVAFSIAPDQSWQPSADELPQQRIILLLASTVGLPFFVLSSTGPLLQDWFRRTYPGRSPYRLYSLSNAGSLLALLTYPVLVEPNWRLLDQVQYWSYGYFAFVVLCGACAAMVRDRTAPIATAPSETPAPAVEPARRPTAVDLVMWTALSTCGSVLMLATTNQMTIDIPPVPFLWIVPLSLYLVSFIICFDNERWYVREVFAALFVVGLAQYLLALSNRMLSAPSMTLEVLIYSMVMFPGLMLCHGELVRMKPAPKHLTLFYLTVSAGGAIGGALITFVAPRVFRYYAEFPTSLAAVSILFVLAVLRDHKRFFQRRSIAYWIFAGAVCVLMLAASLTIALVRWSNWGGKTQLYAARNFFGIVSVDKGFRTDYGPSMELNNGRILHGVQLLTPEARLFATSYYGRQSGVALAMQLHPKRFNEDESERKLRVGVIGLGTGSVKALAQEGDYLRFYEINPIVAAVAQTPEFFTFLRDAPGTYDIVMGDARINLAREAAGLDVEVAGEIVPSALPNRPVDVVYELQKGEKQRFDILVVDAFTSDSIPMHLLTKESFALYLDHLEEDGMVVFNLSNRYLSLEGVVCGLAKEFDLEGALISSQSVPGTATEGATWFVLTRSRLFLRNSTISKVSAPWPLPNVEPMLWTDDYASLWRIVR